jgi:hypothetical protein
MSFCLRSDFAIELNLCPATIQSHNRPYALVRYVRRQEGSIVPSPMGDGSRVGR